MISRMLTCGPAAGRDSRQSACGASVAATSRRFEDFPYGLMAAVLFLSCTAAMAVPKAAEHAGAEVSFGAATVHPKPPSKAITTQPAKKNSRSAKSKGGKSRSTGKPTPRKKAPTRARSKSRSRK